MRFRFNHFRLVLPLALATLPIDGLAATEARRPERIVALNGVVTEIVCALGSTDRLVGVDLSSTWPTTIARLPRVGYQRSISSEGVVSLSPDLVIGTEDAGPPEAIEQIRSTGVRVVVVSNAPGLTAAAERVRAVGRALALESRADSLARAMVKGARAVRTDGPKPRVLAIYARGPQVVMVSGRGTPADSMLALAGARNAVQEFDGYKPLTAEAVVAAAPEWILIPSGGLASLGGVDALLKQPGLAITPAGKQRRVIEMDAEKLLGFGPRVADAVRELSAALRAPAAGGNTP
jgi:iron complex transport system substrate-binding protein